MWSPFKNEEVSFSSSNHTTTSRTNSLIVPLLPVGAFTTIDIRSSRKPLTSPLCPSTKPRTHSPQSNSNSQHPLRSCLSWDSTTFSDKSHLLPEERNGDWRSDAVHAIKNPSAAASSAQEAIQWPYVRDTLTKAVESASETLRERLSRALEGQDLPAIHDNMRNFMPSMQQVSMTMSKVADIAHEVIRGCGPSEILDTEFDGDELAFTRQMGEQARAALVSQRICKNWQILRFRGEIMWQPELDVALLCLFRAERKSFTFTQLCSMTPIWTGNIASKSWHLELDTGLTEIVAEVNGDMSEDSYVALKVDFELPEKFGCLRIKDVEREVKDLGEWTEVIE
ncbi:hypothetical protein GQ44DRAFT_731732 [Phaeosphaeriaceae sp. PMI808]|nr:hypothetical protein GQ44DRAFT_731732 [Phaeosphaeriaceae sp. PMI808]